MRARGGRLASTWREAIKGIPIVGPAATAVAAHFPSPERLRMLPADVRWWASASLLGRTASGRRTAVIVTGCDSSHYRSVLNLLVSLEQHESVTPVSMWDLGLKPTEVAGIAQRFPDVRLTSFPYRQYPDYFRITESAGQYAWKPVIMEAEVQRAATRIVIWLDAGDTIDRRLGWLRRLADANGFYSRRTPGTVRKWTHPGTLRWLRVDESLLDLPNLDGAIVAVDPTSPRARNLVRTWSQCAQTRECIAPDGSDRSNHRQDQAVLTVLAHQAGLAPCGAVMDASPLLGIHTHQDVE